MNIITDLLCFKPPNGGSETDRGRMPAIPGLLFLIDILCVVSWAAFALAFFGVLIAIPWILFFF
jgi:hypothetical protein